MLSESGLFHRRSVVGGITATAVGTLLGTQTMAKSGVPQARCGWAEPLIANAIRASNTFNTQPWIFTRAGKSLALHADLSRSLGAFDIWRRDLYVSVGCALENLILAASAHGWQSEVKLRDGTLSLGPSSETLRSVALVNLTPKPAVKSELFTAIASRHTNRHPFDPRKEIPARFDVELQRLLENTSKVRIRTIREPILRQRLVDLTVSAARTVNSSPDVNAAISPWLRKSTAEWEDHRDGELMAPMPPGVPSLPLHDLLMTSPLMGIIFVQNRLDIPSALLAGRLWQQAHLLATARGIGARPENSIVHLIDRELAVASTSQAAAKLAVVTQDAGWHPCIVFFMGYATAPPTVSPRRPLDAVCLET